MSGDNKGGWSSGDGQGSDSGKASSDWGSGAKEGGNAGSWGSSGKDQSSIANDGGSSWSDAGGTKSPDSGGIASAEAANEGSFTETTTRSWGSRLGGAFAGILVGLLLIPGACWLLFWNEGRAVATARALTEGAGSVVSVAADRPDPARERRLVHVTGPLTVAATLTDGDTGMSVQGAAGLSRQVEMFQWRESSSSSTSTNLGGSQTTQTTYSYARVWSESAINSGQFRQPGGHANPVMALTSRSQGAAEASLGGFRLAEAQLRMLSATEVVAPSEAMIRPIAGRRTQLVGQSIFVGNDPNNPVVGDLRISYRAARPATVSIVAQQQGQGFAAYTTGNGQTLQLVTAGSKTAAEMIQAAESENAILTWILRLVGVVLVFVGFSMIFAPIRVLADVVPLFGSIVGFGTGLISGVLTLVIAPLVIAVAWFAHRPIMAAIVLAVGVALAFGLSRLRRSRRAPVGAVLAR